MTRIPFLLLAALVALGPLTGCKGTPSRQAPETGATPAEVFPVAEDPKARTERLLYLEKGIDQWWLAHQEQDYARRDSMKMLIGPYVACHFDGIVSDLRTGSPRYRQTMAAALGFSGMSEALAHLELAIKDQYFEVVEHGLLSLYMLANDGIQVDPEVVMPYLRHPRPEVRNNAALVLSRVVGVESPRDLMVPLVSAATDPDDATRSHAVAAIASLGGREAVPHLVKALQDRVELVRIRAALGLGRVGDRDAVPYLIEVLDGSGEPEDVRRAAARGLAAIFGQQGGRISTDAAYWRGEAERVGILLPSGG